MPTIAYWPCTIEPTSSPALINQIDFFASIAALLDQELPEEVAIDSKNLLDALLGRSQMGRKEMIEESFTLALRDQQWKYIRPITKNKPRWIARDKNIEGGFEHFPQLFNLEEDLSEKNNLAEKFPQKILEMENRLIELEQKLKR